VVDQGKVQDVNEAARRFAETLADSYRLIYGQAGESAERQQQRAREFSELVQGNLKEQAEAGRANVQQLSEQASRQQEAGQEFARESVEAYTQFLDDAFSRYRAGTDQAVGNVRRGARTLSETATGLGRHRDWGPLAPRRVPLWAQRAPRRRRPSSPFPATTI
jgi:dsDNA-specific endonuclease/ATPase MutS2